jgi:hypothetical protein
LGLKEDILFLEIVNFFILGGAAKLRWAGRARSAPLGVAMSPERRVRVRTKTWFFFLHQAENNDNLKATNKVANFFIFWNQMKNFLKTILKLQRKMNMFR